MKQHSNESKFLVFLYHTVLGRFFLKFFCSRFFSKLCGMFLDSRISKRLIRSFISKHHINIEDYYHENFHSFNDFFCRKIREELRPIDYEENHFISPCDGYLSAYHIKSGLVLPIKQSEYTISSLLQNEELAKQYEDGICLVFRLCVNHYHRYCYVDEGMQEENKFIPGMLHTVRPIALESTHVFVENCREYTVLHTKHFQDIVMMEVGAMLVGKIHNNHEYYHFSKGEEKGVFLYGGSTIILLIQKDAVEISEKYFKATKLGKELSVLMGEKIGTSKF